MIDVVRNNVERIVRLHQGHTYRTADLLLGFFPDAEAARAAASAIASTGVSVMVCGSQIMVVA